MNIKSQSEELLIITRQNIDKLRSVPDLTCLRRGLVLTWLVAQDVKVH